MYWENRLDELLYVHSLHWGLCHKALCGSSQLPIFVNVDAQALEAFQPTFGCLSATDAAKTCFPHA